MASHWPASGFIVENLNLLPTGALCHCVGSAFERYTKWFKLSFAADDPITQEDACPEDSNCPGECYCEGGTVDCSHRELKGNKLKFEK